MRFRLMRFRLITIAALVALAALAFSACGDSETQATAESESGTPVSAETSLPSRVNVRMGEWFFRSDTPRVKAGKITVTARNVGEIDHELIGVKTDLPAEELPMTDEGLDADRAGKLVIGEPHSHSEGGEAEHGDDHADEHGDDHADEHGDHEHGDAHGDEAAEEGHLEPGETRTYQVTLKPGKYVLLCSIPGHYQMGQYVSLIVE